jgi:hypothetical protein
VRLRNAWVVALCSERLCGQNCHPESAAGGVVALAMLGSHDATGANSAAAGAVILPITGAVLLGGAIYEIATTPRDVREATRVKLQPLPGGAAPVVRFQDARFP